MSLSASREGDHLNALFKIDDFEMAQQWRRKDASFRDYALNGVCHFLGQIRVRLKQQYGVVAGPLRVGYS